MIVDSSNNSTLSNSEESRSSSSLRMIKDLIGLLPPRQKKLLGVLLLGSMLAALTETLGLGCIALFASSIANPDTILQTDLFAKISMRLPQLKAMTSSELVVVLGIIVTIIVCLKNVLRAVVQYYYGRITAFIAGHYADVMLTGFLKMPYEWLLKKNSADLIRVVIWARNSGMTLGSVLQSLSDIFFVVFMLSVLLFANPLAVLSAVAMLLVPALVFSRGLRKTIDKVARRKTEYEKRAHRNLTMILQGIKDVKIFGMEEAFCDKYRSDIYMIPRCHAKADVLTSLPGWGLEISGFGMLVGLTFIMFFGFGASSEEVARTIALLAVAAWRGLPAVVRIVNYLNHFRKQLPLIETTLYYSAEIRKTVSNYPSKPYSLVFSSRIDFEKISFSYGEGEQKILQDISFSIQPGESVGIVGESGAGKSTLADILIGLLKPKNGRILIDGEILSEAGHLDMVGYVPQSPYIYDSTLAENVAFGEELVKVDMDRVHRACEMAAVDGFVKALPEGYETSLGERGVRLSGGQQQRICVARALYNDPTLMIFDEATSSLDSKSERQIQQTINGLKGQVTMIIVAHRLSTVEHCDRLIWLENGKIKRIGVPDEILPEYKNTLRIHQDESTC